MKITTLLSSLLAIAGLAACGGSTDNVNAYVIYADTVEGGRISPSWAVIDEGKSTSFTVTADEGYQVNSVSGCNGTYQNGQYSVGPITENCTVTAEFVLDGYSIKINQSVGGNVEPESAVVQLGESAVFTISPNSDFEVKTVSGCGGSLVGDQFTTGVTAVNCEITVEFEARTFATPDISLVPAKTLQMTWRDISTATHYRILENKDGLSGFTQVGDDIQAGVQVATISIPLHLRKNASYILQTCTEAECLDSPAQAISATINNAIGYLKAAPSDADDYFGGTASDATEGDSETGGSKVALSRDGNTLVVAAPEESSAATGINGDAMNNDASASGAAYVFVRDGSSWRQQAYLKPNQVWGDQRFGSAVAISADGNRIAVGAVGETVDLKGKAGAVYVFNRSGETWAQTSHLTASNAGSDDVFGSSLAFNEDGSLLAVGAPGRARPTGLSISGKNSGDGAVYVFQASGNDWTERDYLKSLYAGARYHFGFSISFNGEGDLLAIGSPGQASAARGIVSGASTNESDKSAIQSGAVFLYDYREGAWQRNAFVNASNTDSGDKFGSSVHLSKTGDTLVVGAPYEQSVAIGVNGDQSDNSKNYSGAVYVFENDGSAWQQQAYLKAYDHGQRELGSRFGERVALSDEGDQLVVSLEHDHHDGAGLDTIRPDQTLLASGAVEVFRRETGEWTSVQVVKASHPFLLDGFGASLSLSGDGNTLAVSAPKEDSNAEGFNDTPSSAIKSDSGAVYIY